MKAQLCTSTAKLRAYYNSHLCIQRLWPRSIPLSPPGISCRNIVSSSHCQRQIYPCINVFGSPSFSRTIYGCSLSVLDSGLLCLMIFDPMGLINCLPYPLIIYYVLDCSIFIVLFSNFL